MATIPPFVTNFIILLLLLLHLGCFIIFPTSRHHRHRPKPPSLPPLRRISSTKHKRHKSLSSTWSFIKRIFSSSKPTSQIIDGNSSIFHQIPSPGSSTRSISIIPPDTQITTRPDSDYIHPCLNCGEIFQKPGLLEQHQSLKHAVYELLDDDPGKNIVRIIFTNGWLGKNPLINRVMKIHNSPKILTRFEEYRETVKSKAARHGGSWRRDERCIADGNELLRFHCTTFLCDLGQNGNSSICSHQGRSWGF